MLLQQRSRKYMPRVSFSIDNRGNSWSKWMFYSGDASKISLVEDWMEAAHLCLWMLEITCQWRFDTLEKHWYVE